jgi:cell division cycle 14
MQARPSKPIEIMKGKLYWVSSAKPPRGIGKAFFFNVDKDLKYYPFFKDFGPLSLGQTYRFVTELRKLLRLPAYRDCPIYHHTSTNPEKRANAAFLICAFQILVLNRSADEAWSFFADLKPKLKAFRDASYYDCNYKCTILDCLRGLEFAVKLGWFDLESFDVKEYEHFEKVENGDLNWIIPGKFLAFCTPKDDTRTKHGYKQYTPEDYVPILRKFGARSVIRLNKPEYDSRGFTDYGIKHYDLFFVDGSCPSDSLVERFVRIAEKEKGAIAVHCKAGLGRTGTMIGMYLMKHYKIPAAAFIGWIRLARPGSVLGHQQQFLNEKQNEQFGKGKESGVFGSLGRDEKRLIRKFGELSARDPRVKAGGKVDYRRGESGQGERLNRMKRR